METKNLAELYDLPTMPWTAITDRLQQGIPQAPGDGGYDRHTIWLATINPDGAPHVTAVGAMWVDGAFWFVTGRSTRKGRNLARDPRCSISVGTREFDLTIDGVAVRVTDPPTVARMAAVWAAEGWPCEVDGSGEELTAPYSAPSAGKPPWSVYRIDAARATALGTVEPGGATRWTF
jgi:hypothetical protein